jgi:hypothetical protein
VRAVDLKVTVYLSDDSREAIGMPGVKEYVGNAVIDAVRVSSTPNPWFTSLLGVEVEGLGERHIKGQ